MRPERAAKILAQAGVLLLALLLLLRGLSLSETAQSPAVLAFPVEAQLVTNQFSFSADSKRVIFHQELVPAPKPDKFKPVPAWFSMSLEGGAITAAEKPEVDLRPFVLRENKLFILVGDGFSLTTGSLPNTIVRIMALSPDRSTMVFNAEPDNQGSALGGLYVLDKSGQLNWLGEEEQISALAWSPDSQRIAYIAPRDGVNQLITIDRDGNEHRQLTSDPAPKRAPSWLADSKTIVYSAQTLSEDGSTPADPAGESLYQVTLETASPVLLAGGLGPVSSLSAVSNNRVIAFTQPTPGQERSEQLFLLNPENNTLRRAYPTLSIDEVTCPTHLSNGKAGTIRLVINNTANIAASAPLILRVSDTPPHILGERELNAQRIESVDVVPGETRSVDWPVRPVPGLYTYLSVLINLGDLYPLSEQHCAVPNTYFGLPNLGFLAFTLPLLIPGMLLVLPWLRHRKQRWLWALWIAFPLLILILIAVEARMVS